MNRFKKALEAYEIWKILVEKALTAVTDNLRGYKELLNYFYEYVKYENLLFAIDEKYRDHTIHSIWVLMLGFHLRNYFDPFKKIEYPIAIRGIGITKDALNKAKKNRKKTLNILKEE